MSLKKDHERVSAYFPSTFLLLLLSDTQSLSKAISDLFRALILLYSNLRVFLNTTISCTSLLLMIRMTLTVCCSKKGIAYGTDRFTVRWILDFTPFGWILNYEPEGRLIPKRTVKSECRNDLFQSQIPTVTHVG